MRILSVFFSNVLHEHFWLNNQLESVYKIILRKNEVEPSPNWFRRQWSLFAWIIDDSNCTQLLIQWNLYFFLLLRISRSFHLFSLCLEIRLCFATFTVRFDCEFEWNDSHSLLHSCNNIHTYTHTQMHVQSPHDTPFQQLVNECLLTSTELCMCKHNYIRRSIEWKIHSLRTRLPTLANCVHSTNGMHFMAISPWCTFHQTDDWSLRTISVNWII